MDAVAAGCLCLKEGLVSLTQQLGCRYWGGRCPARNPAAECHHGGRRGSGVVGYGELRHRLSDPPGGDAGVAAVAAVGQEQKELLAAVAVDAFACASRLVEAACDLAQGFVAGEMTVVVVVEFEVVDVEQSYGVGSISSERPGVGALEVFFHAAAVSEAGQSIVERQFEQPEVGVLEPVPMAVILERFLEDSLPAIIGILLEPL
jgi:hypothetical protein